MGKTARQPIWKTYKSGITMNSILAILYALLVFTPAQIYLTLMTGTGISEVGWFTLLLWIEFASLAGRRLSKQEAFFILAFSTTAYVPIILIQRAWFRGCDIAYKLGIVEKIPDWAAPPPDSGVLELRTFFHPAWVPAISVNIIAALITLVLGLGLNLFAREMFVQVERLPFPMQIVMAQGISVLTEGARSQRYLFSVSAFLSFIYSFFLYTAPALAQVIGGVYLTFIPVPFVDLTRWIEPILPGAILGIGTTLSSFTLGWFIPFRMVLGMFLASLGVGIFGNWLSVINRWVPDTDPITPGYQGWWLPGMDIPMIMARSTLYFWTSIFLGAGFALAVAPIVTHPKRFAQTLSAVFKPRRSVSTMEDRIIEPISFTKVTLPLLIVGTIGTIAIFWALIPDFVATYPWILIFPIFLPITNTMVYNWLLGTVGVSSQPLAQIAYIPYWSAQITYPGVAQWFAPSIWDNVVGDASMFKVCQMLETRDIDYIKLTVILWPISIILGYLYLQAFWSVAPIPSGRWPATAIYWPQWAAQFGVTMRGLYYNLLHIDWLIYSFLGFLALYMLLELTRCPIPYIAIASGIGFNLPQMISALIGSIFAHMIRRRVGDEWWYENRYTLGAGVATGTALAVTMAVALSLITSSVWALPF